MTLNLGLLIVLVVLAAVNVYMALVHRSRSRPK